MLNCLQDPFVAVWFCEFCIASRSLGPLILWEGHFRLGWSSNCLHLKELITLSQGPVGNTPFFPQSQPQFFWLHPRECRKDRTVTICPFYAKGNLRKAQWHAQVSPATVEELGLEAESGTLSSCKLAKFNLGAPPTFSSFPVSAVLPSSLFSLPFIFHSTIS